MKIENQPLENHQVKLIVEVEPEAMEAAKHRSAREIAKKIKIPGFRPGKAPYPVILRQVGESALIEDAVEHLVDEIYPKVIEESGIKPYGPGSLENIAKLDPPVLEFVVPLEPTATLGDYHGISHSYEPKAVDEGEVNQVLENIREQQAVIEPVERAAQEGDQVTIRLSGERTQAEEGKDPTLIRERSMPVVIRPEGQADLEEAQREWPFPGFSRQLIGLSAGDEGDITYTFPEESDFESLRGVDANFHFQVENVKSRTLPELDDEVARSVGEYDNLEALRSAIRADLQNRADQTYHSTYDELTIDDLVAGAEIKYPPQMVENEIESMLHDLEHNLSHQGLDMELYLKTLQKDMAGLREELRESAEKRVKRSLALMELTKSEGVEVSPEEVQQEAAMVLTQLSQTMDPKEAQRLNDRRVISNVISNVAADLMNRRTIERLRSIASGGLYTPPVVEKPEVAQEAEASLDEQPENNAPTDIASEEAGSSEPSSQTVEVISASAVLDENSSPVDNTGSPEADDQS